MNKYYFFMALILTTTAIKANLAERFKSGHGAEFMMHKQSSPDVKVSIYVTKSSLNELHLEYAFIAQNTFAPSEMWQQFVFEVAADKKVEIKQGYILSGTMKVPEVMPSSVYGERDGIELKDFLFAEKSQLKKFFIKQEKIRVPAGEIVTDHYRKKKQGTNCRLLDCRSSGAHRFGAT